MPSRRPRVLCVGATIVDALGRPVSQLPDGQQGRQLLEEIRITAAGTAAGTAVDLAKLGAEVALIGAVGRDTLADFLKATLGVHGIDTSGLVAKPGVQTSATLLPIRPNGDRPALHCPGATSLLAADDVDPAVVGRFDAVHLGAPDVLGPFGGEPAQRLLARARHQAVVTSVDVLSPCDASLWPTLGALMPYVDYFLPNDQQLRNLTGVEDIEDAARRILAAGAGAVLVSCGPDGCLVVTGVAAFRVPAIPPEVLVDTTGCGDATSAGFLLGMLHGWTITESAWLAMAAGGLVAGGLGSDAGIVDLPGTASRIVDAAPAEIAEGVAAHLRELATDPAGSADPPSYRELPPAAAGGRSGWGVFGADDSPGTVALQTPARIIEASRLVFTGELFPLNAPVTVPDPPLFLRRPTQHTLLTEPQTPGFDDKLDSFYPQGSSQWDSLAHVGYAPDVFYNGVSQRDIRDDHRNTIDVWAKRGIAGRAVLLDVDAVLRGHDAAYSPGTSRAITVDDLEAARAIAGVSWQPGDILLLHTGFLHWYTQQDPEIRQAMAASEEFAAVGLERSEHILEYLWDAKVSAVASDNGSVEVWPPDWGKGPFGFLHRMLIGQLGLALGELWWLHDLALSCRADGRYTMFLTAAPMHLPGGIGSPANALAVK